MTEKRSDGEYGYSGCGGWRKVEECESEGSSG